MIGRKNLEKLNKQKGFKLVSQKVNLTDFSEKILLMIKFSK